MSHAERLRLRSDDLLARSSSRGCLVSVVVEDFVSEVNVRPSDAILLLLMIVILGLEDTSGCGIEGDFVVDETCF